MKNLLIAFMVLICGTAFGQYPFNTTIEPNLDKGTKYTQMSETENPRPRGKRYASKGQYKSVTADVFKEQFLRMPITFESGTYDASFSDSANISAVSGGSFAYQIIGDIIYISGELVIDAIQDSVQTTVHVSLPDDLLLHEDEYGAGSGCESNAATLGQGINIRPDDGLMLFEYNPKLGSISTEKTFRFTFMGKLED